MNIRWTDTVLSSKQGNISVYEHLLNLFVEEWSAEMNYSKYFDDCSPSLCTYTTTDRTNLSYAITLMISLYGGLIILLRLISPFLIHLFFKIKYFSRNTTPNLSKFKN